MGRCGPDRSFYSHGDRASWQYCLDDFLDDFPLFQLRYDVQIGKRRLEIAAEAFQGGYSASLAMETIQKKEDGIEIPSSFFIFNRNL